MSGNEMNNVRRDPKAAILIPTYKTNFDQNELLSLRSTLHHLGHRDEVYWLVPDGFDCSELDKTYGKRRRQEFSQDFFGSVADYSRLLLSPQFYERFHAQYSHILIVQTDAAVLHDKLDYWVRQPYNYFCAPWPKGWSYPLNGILQNGSELRCSALVGNGGFSLRQVEPTLQLLEEFPLALQECYKTGFPEDFYIGLAASVSSFYMVPNIKVASAFAIELEPHFFAALNNCAVPFGLHAWHRYDQEGWSRVIQASLDESKIT